MEQELKGTAKTIKCKRKKTIKCKLKTMARRWALWLLFRSQPTQ